MKQSKILFDTAEELAADESFQNYCLKDSDSKRWNKFLKANPSKLELFEEAQMLVMLLSPYPIHQQIPKTSPIRINLIKIASIFLILLILGIGSIYYYTIEAENPIQTHIASNNLSILLSDLSKIDVRAGGVVRFAEKWEKTPKRELWLEGEAYFDVEKSKDKPKEFIIHLQKGEITVLGTKFIAISDSSYTKIILEEGLVNYVIGNKTYSMEAGDALIYNDEMVSIQHNKNTRNFDSWRNDQISFKNTSIEDIILTINNSYGLNVEIGTKSLRDRNITATVNKNDPMLLLEAIAEIYNIKIIQDSNKIILK